VLEQALGAQQPPPHALLSTQEQARCGAQVRAARLSRVTSTAWSLAVAPQLGSSQRAWISTGKAVMLWHVMKKGVFSRTCLTF